MSQMPLEAAFDKRTAYMHHALCQRLSEKRFKSGPRKGQIFRHALPFTCTLPEFRAFILKLLGGKRNGYCPCHYCQCPLDAMNIGLDHEQPLAQSGTSELINLKPCCTECNRLKGNLSPLGFAWLKHQLVHQVGKTLTIADAKDIMMRLKSGGGFYKTRKKAKDATARLKQQETQEVF